MSKRNEWISKSTLVKLQAGSGLAFGTFASLHLINSLSANFGHLAYDGVQAFFRKYYQNPVVEIVMVGGALIVHSTASALLIIRRQQYQKKKEDLPSGRESFLSNLISNFELSPAALHRYTGSILIVKWIGTDFVAFRYYLFGTMLVHVFFTRILFLLEQTSADFSYLTFSLINWPLLFYPYYFLLGCSGLYHLAYGAQQALRVFGVKVPAWISSRRGLFWVLVGSGCVGIISAVFAFSGLYFPVPTSRFPEFRRSYEFLPSIFLPWIK